jgi:hypothetical protein
MLGLVVFAVFVVAMVVLAVFVIRFAVALNRKERPTRRRMPPGAGPGQAP